MSIWTAEQAERGLVASIVSEGQRVLDEVGDIIKPEHLHTPKYRQIYHACFDLYGAGQEINIVTVTHQLQQNGCLDEAGGGAEVHELFTEGRGTVAATIFTNAILVKFKARKIAKMLEWATVELNNENEDLSQELENKSIEINEPDHDENRTQSAIVAIQAEIAIFKTGEKRVGITTGIPSWDYTLHGLVDGRLYAVAARPGMGKTAMCEQMAINLLIQGHPVLIFSLDMSPEMLLKRTACRTAGIPFQKYEHGRCTPDELDKLSEYLSEIGTYKLFILSPNRLTGGDIRATVRSYKRRHKIRCVILDHVQLLETGDDIREGLTKASIQIRQSATQSGVAHIVLAHLNRNAKAGERPKPSDIKEFDQLFGDCDCLALLWSEAEESDVKGNIPIKFTVSKNRYGPVCEDEMQFNGPTMTFRKMDHRNEQ